MSQSRRTGLPVTVKMRHNAHYVEEIISRSGAAIGKMIPIEQIVPNADQPRKDRGDLKGLVESVREKGVLEPLLVRYMPESEKYMIISGERRYFASRAAGLSELPCIEKDADDAETLELALIENLQRKDLTPFEEADGIQSLGDRFAMTHDEIAKKLGKGSAAFEDKAQALEHIDKPFDFLPLPNLNHSYKGDGLATALAASADYFARYLGNE